MNFLERNKRQILLTNTNLKITIAIIQMIYSFLRIKLQIQQINGNVTVAVRVLKMRPEHIIHNQNVKLQPLVDHQINREELQVVLECHQQDLILLYKEINLEISFTNITHLLRENTIYGYQMTQDWQD